MGGYAAGRFAPSVGPWTAVPQNVVGVNMNYLRLRMTTSPVAAPSFSGHQAVPFGVSPCNPVTDGWAIVGA